jgi:hypothetical protein
MYDLLALYRNKWSLQDWQEIGTPYYQGHYIKILEFFICKQT